MTVLRKFFLSLVFICLGAVALLSSDPLHQFKAVEPYPAPVDVVLKGFDGNEIKLSDYKGKTIVLNFWATWCMPCIAEMPSLHKLAQLYKHDDFVVLAVAKDEKGPITPKEFRKRSKFYQMMYAMDASENGLFEQLEVEGLPTTLIINEDGMVVGKLVGGTDWVHEDMLNLIQQYIDGHPPKPTKLSLAEQLAQWFEKTRSSINKLFTKMFKEKEEPKIETGSEAIEEKTDSSSDNDKKREDESDSDSEESNENKNA